MQKNRLNKKNVKLWNNDNPYELNWLKLKCGKKKVSGFVVTDIQESTNTDHKRALKYRSKLNIHHKSEPISDFIVTFVYILET